MAYATFSQTSLRGLSWLAGGGYNHFGLYVHGVQYQKASGKFVKGTCLPVIFEDCMDSIMSGHEELGLPKVVSDIDVHQREGSYHIVTNWRGATWGRFSLKGLKPVKESAVQKPSTDRDFSEESGLLIHRYMSAVGADRKGVSEAEYPMLVSCADEEKHEIRRPTWSMATSDAIVDIDGLDWESLPTLHHIVFRLAEIPVFSVVEAKMIGGKGVADLSTAKEICWRPQFMTSYPGGSDIRES